MSLYKSHIFTQPARPLDQLVAEKVFGYKVELREHWIYELSGDHPIMRWEMLVETHNAPIESGDDTWEEWVELANYSTDWNDAKLIVKFLTCAHVEIRFPYNDGVEADATWYDEAGVKHEVWGDRLNTLPLALCDVALKYVNFRDMDKT